MGNILNTLSAADFACIAAGTMVGVQMLTPANPIGSSLRLLKQLRSQVCFVRVQVHVPVLVSVVMIDDDSLACTLLHCAGSILHCSADLSIGICALSYIIMICEDDGLSLS